MSDQLILMKDTELRALVFEAVTLALSQHTHQAEPKKPYITCKDAADYLGKTTNALRQLVCKDQIKYIKKGSLLYFRTEDLIQYLEGDNKDEADVLKRIGGHKR